MIWSVTDQSIIDDHVRVGALYSCAASGFSTEHFVDLPLDATDDQVSAALTSAGEQFIPIAAAIIAGTSAPDFTALSGTVS